MGVNDKTCLLWSFLGHSHCGLFLMGGKRPGGQKTWGGGQKVGGGGQKTWGAKGRGGGKTGGQKPVKF